MFLALQIDIGLWPMQANVRVRVEVPQLLGFNFATVEDTRIFSRQPVLNPCVISCGHFHDLVSYMNNDTGGKY